MVRGWIFKYSDPLKPPIGYVKETSAFTMYLLGFQSGYNMAAKDTYDIFSGEEVYPLLSWAENYCRANPSIRFIDALIALSNNRYPKRQRVHP